MTSLEAEIIVAATNGDMATVRHHLAAMHPKDHSRILTACEWIRDEDVRMRWETERDDQPPVVNVAYLEATAEYWRTKADRMQGILRGLSDQIITARRTDPYPPEPPVGSEVYTGGHLAFTRSDDGWHCPGKGDPCRNCPCIWEEVWDRTGTNVDSTIVLPWAGER